MKRIFCAVFVVLTILLCAVPIVAADGSFETVSVPISQTTCEEDLKNTQYGGKAFDFDQYLSDHAQEDFHVMTIREYKWDATDWGCGQYALYVYLCNPQGHDIYEDSPANKIQLTTQADESGFPTQFESYDLEYCSAWGRFYKYKIVLPTEVIYPGSMYESVIPSLAIGLDSNSRFYATSGIEIHRAGELTAISYASGRRFWYRGTYLSEAVNYATEDVDVLSLEITNKNHTSFIFNGEKSCEVHSIYFSLPKKISGQKYDDLQRIRAEWWQYKLVPILLAVEEDGKNQYTYIKDYLQDVYVAEGEYKKTHPTNGEDLWFLADATDKGVIPVPHWGWNGTSVVTYPVMPFVYNATGKEENEVVASWEQLLSDIQSKGLYTDQYIEVLGHKYPAELFDRYDGDGYKVVDKYADQLFKLDGKGSNSAFSQWFWGLFDAYDSVDRTDITPIYLVTADDFKGTTEEIADRLLISETDVEKIRDAFNSARISNENFYLFRYDVSSYDGGNTVYSDYGDIIENLIDGPQWVQQECYLGFRLLELGFEKDGTNFTVPVSVQRSDHVGNVTMPNVPAPDLDDFAAAFGGFASSANELWEQFKKILGLVLVIVLAVIALPLVIKVFGFVGRQIGKIVSQIKNNKRKR